LVWDEAYRANIPHVTRYYRGLAAEPQFAKVMGEIALCKEPLR
jgi:hypothetical protein